MIRDTTQIINLTSIVNMIISGLVGGIVIYTIQKKIDATIQKSLFVSQTKFSAIHSKTVETLATLFDKSALLMNKYLDILREVEQNKSFVFDHDYDILSKHGEDFLDYYDRTRLFLDETAKDEMQKITTNVKLLMVFLSMADTAHNLSLEISFPLNQLIKASGIKINSVDVRNPNARYLLCTELGQIRNQSMVIETLYKSVAEA